MGPGPGMPVFDGLIVYAVALGIAALIGLLSGWFAKRLWVAAATATVFSGAATLVGWPWYREHPVADVIGWQSCVMAVVVSCLLFGGRKLINRLRPPKPV